MFPITSPITSTIAQPITAQSGGVTPPAPSGDTLFMYNTLLLHGDGANGAQNNTFVDGSTNAFSITRNGTPTQGSFSPYGSLWSNYLSGVNGSSGTPITGTTAALAVGTGDFTYEFWVYFTTIGSVAEEQMFCTRGAGTGVQTTRRGNNWTFDFNSTASRATATGVLTANNQWYHIAVSRQSGTLRIFTNGVLNATTAGNTDNFTSTSLSIGALNSNTAYPLTGNISNLRFVAGTALYTANFTPSTAPLTAVAGTALLTCQSNLFIDNSSNNYALTPNGAIVQRFSPFEPTQAYSPATTGGSGYFNGSTDYLNLGGQAGFAFGSGDFTIEGWVYQTSSSTYVLYDSRPTSTNGAYILLYGDASAVYLYANSGNVITSSAPLPLNAWSHVAVSRSGTSTKLFVNGVQAGATYTDSNSYLNGASRPLIGANGFGVTNYFPGYIADFRVLKGTALYTATFTPPTAPLTAVTNTSLLLNMTNAGIVDNAAGNDLTTVGNAQVSTAVVKYGTGSIKFNGTSDYLSLLQSPMLDFGSGDFTVEGWVNVNATSYQHIISIQGASSSYAALRVYIDTGGVFVLLMSTSGSAWAVNSGAVSSISTSTWVHFAAVRNGTSIKLYINGTSVYSGTVSGAVMTGAYSSIGAVFVTSSYSSFLNGYIDDLRVTKGYARYTANFTPPAAALPDF